MGEIMVDGLGILQRKIVLELGIKKEPMSIDELSKLLKTDSKKIEESIKLLIKREILKEDNGKYTLVDSLRTC